MSVNWPIWQESKAELMNYICGDNHSTSKNEGGKALK